MRGTQPLSVRLAAFYANRKIGISAFLIPTMIAFVQLSVYFSGLVADSFFLGIAVAFLAVGYFLLVIRGLQLIGEDAGQRRPTEEKD